jgi:hypothetical protein
MATPTARPMLAKLLHASRPRDTWPRASLARVSHTAAERESSVRRGPDVQYLARRDTPPLPVAPNRGHTSQRGVVLMSRRIWDAHMHDGTCAQTGGVGRAQKVRDMRMDMRTRVSGTRTGRVRDAYGTRTGRARDMRRTGIPGKVSRACWDQLRWRRAPALTLQPNQLQPPDTHFRLKAERARAGLSAAGGGEGQSGRRHDPYQEP